MITLEHTLVILLLLVGLLNAKPKIPKLAWWAIASALLLVLLAPAFPIILPWEWLSALIIPVLLWQVAERLAREQMPLTTKDLVIWSGMALGISGILLVTSELTAAGSFMFGLLAASMVWRAVEEDRQPTPLGQVGALALAFLLAEIAPAVEAPGRYGIALIAGASIGALVGYVAVRAAQRLQQRAWHNILSIGQVYLGYGIAAFFNLSGVAAAIMGVAVYVAYGTKSGLWSEGSIRPKPLDSVPVYTLAVLALAFFAWQTHVPITPLLLLEIGLGLFFTVLVIWIARRLGSEPFLLENSYTRITVRVGLLLLPAILLWSRGALLDPLPLVIALGAATLVTIAVFYTLTPLLHIYAWLDEAGTNAENPDQLINTLLVHDLMDRNFVTISSTTPVPEIARLFTEKRMECLPVIDDERHLLGIVTENDLFVKEERLPGTRLTYQAVFRTPITPEQLHNVYAQRGAIYTAADVMTSKVVWVKDTSSIGQAVRLMVSHGFRCLPVLESAQEADGKLVGIITRSGIVRLLAEAEQSSIRPTLD
jgi:CBS domain-containing protein